jgi:hypothetical protein
MRRFSSKLIFRLGIVLTLILGITLLVRPYWTTQAAPPDPTSGTVSILAQSDNDNTSDNTNANDNDNANANDNDNLVDDNVVAEGAYILLQAGAFPAGSWNVVQWLDQDGIWQDVDAWEAPLPVDGQQNWWVAPKDFGTGPFRWVVTQGQDGTVLGTSGEFTMPTGSGQTVRVVVSPQQ